MFGYSWKGWNGMEWNTMEYIPSLTLILLTKNPNRAAAGGIFRNSDSLCVGCFTQYLGEQNALYAELVAAMTAIEIAHINGFSNFLLETDSQLVILAFKSLSVVPWVLRNRWLNCLVRIREMSFLVSHVYREGNACADNLANVGLALNSANLFWSDDLRDSIREEYNRNRLGTPNFRFTTFWKGFGIVPLFFMYSFFGF